MGKVDNSLLERSTEERFNKYSLPDYMAQGYVYWIVYAITPGDFLQGVLKNDLYHAVIHADNRNLHCLEDWIMLLQNDAPVGSWGSNDNVMAWKRNGGLSKLPVRPEMHRTTRPPQTR